LGNSIAVVGSLNMDVIVRVERLPVPGQTVIGEDVVFAPGGKGANQAVAAARLGARVALLGRLGRDAFGSQLRMRLSAEGVDDTWVSEGPEPTGVASIMVDRAGQNVIAVAPGANAALALADVASALDHLADVSVVVAELEVPLSAVLTAAHWAREAQVPFVLNAAPARPDLEQLLPYVTVLILNESEAGVLLGHAIHDGNDAAATLLKRGPSTVVITLGDRGAVYATGTEVAHVTAPRVTVVDTTGAGDAFVGALAVQWAAGTPLAEAVRFACAAGALACTQTGAQAALPRDPQVRALLSAPGGTARSPRLHPGETAAPP
jgi:ribokinase